MAVMAKIVAPCGMEPNRPSSSASGTFLVGIASHQQWAVPGSFLDLVSGIPACSPATVDDNEFWLPTFSEAPRCAFLSAASLLRVLF
jgi:hypothetical protein